MGLRNIIAKRDMVQNSLGQPLAGGNVFLYEPGTTTFIQAFKDSGLITPHPTPIRLSGSGRTNAWINRDCDVRIEDRNGNLILTEPNANPDALGANAAGGLIANGSFETDTDSDGTPDSWVLVDEAGSTNARDTSESTDGVASMRFTSSGTGGGDLTTTNFFPVNDIDDLRVEFDLRSTVAAVRNIVRVEWYDVSQVSISDSDIYDSTANPTTFTSQALSVTPPALARFAKLKIIGIDPSVALAGSTFFDRCAVFYPATVSGIFDNIEILNNSIITTNTNGNLFLTPDGTGIVVVGGDLQTTGGTFLPTGSTGPADPAAFGFGAVFGAMIAGQGSTNDITLLNDLGQIALRVPTGTVNVVIEGNLTTLGVDDNASLEVLQLADTTMAIGPTGAASNYTIRRPINDGSMIIVAGAGSASGASIELYGNTHATLADDMLFQASNQTWMRWDESVGDLSFRTGSGVKSDALTLADQNATFEGRIYLAEVTAGGDVANFGQIYVDINNDLIYRDEAGAELNISTSVGSSGLNNEVQLGDGVGGFQTDSGFLYSGNQLSVENLLINATNTDALRILSSGSVDMTISTGAASTYNMNFENNGSLRFRIQGLPGNDHTDLFKADATGTIQSTMRFESTDGDVVIFEGNIVTERFRFDVSTGNFTMGGLLDLSGANAGQIQFPVTANLSTNANTLDDYQESTTFLPALQDNSFSPSEGQTYSTQSGAHTKFGNVVFISFRMVVTSLGTLTVGDVANIGNLPYPPNGNGGFMVSNAGDNQNQLSAGTVLATPVGPTDPRLQLKIANTTLGVANMLVSEVSANGTLEMSGWYFTDS